MCLQDPAEPLNDLGRIAYRIKDIRCTFRSFHNKLDAWLETGQMSHDRTSILEVMLGNSLVAFKARRERFTQWAENESGKADMTYYRNIAAAARRGGLKGQVDSKLEGIAGAMGGTRPEDMQPNKSIPELAEDAIPPPAPASSKPADDFVANYDRLGGRLLRGEHLDLPGVDADEEVKAATENSNP